MEFVEITIQHVRTQCVKIAGCLIVVIIFFKLSFVVGSKEVPLLRTNNYWNVVRKNARRLYKMTFCVEMSAIKTHEMYKVIDGGEIMYEADGQEHALKVTTLVVERQRPNICQILTEKENVGSMARKTKCFQASIDTITPSDSCTEFSVNTKLYHNFYNLQLKTVRSESSECTIS